MPNRIIKESICTNEKIAALKDFEFRLWVGLITQADDAGRGDARPQIIKGRVFPLRESVTAKNIDDGLHTLASHGLVVLYMVDGKPFYVFPSWSEHQRIRDCKPKYPSPEESDNLPQSAASCGELPQTAAIIQSKYESESESKTSAGFDAFWEQYPRHTAKEAARKAWAKLNPSTELQEQIIAAVLVYKASPQWTKDGGQYIPHPSTFLNQRRWEDEIAGSSEDYYQRLYNQFAEEEANEQDRCR